MNKISFLLLNLFLIFTSSAVAQTIDAINVTNQNINIPGTLTILTWSNNHSNESYEYPKLYYAFAQGDEVMLNFNSNNKKGTQRIAVVEYNSKSVIYSNNSFQTLSDIKFRIPKTAIYQFEFGTNHIFDRQCLFNLKRIPASEKTVSFNYNVIWKETYDTTFSFNNEKVYSGTKYEAVSVLSPNGYFVNSATKIGGKTRLIIPINIPDSTVEWYYTFTATRNKSDIDKTQANMSLLADLSKLIDKSGSISFAINALTEPPGSNYCDIFLFSNNNHIPFLRKEIFTPIQEATRVNLMSGVVNVKNCCNTGQYIIGIRNTDLSYGVAVMIEVVAIKKYDLFEAKTIRKVQSITKNRIPMMNI